MSTGAIKSLDDIKLAFKKIHENDKNKALLNLIADNCPLTLSEKSEHSVVFSDTHKDSRIDFETSIHQNAVSVSLTVVGGDDVFGSHCYTSYKSFPVETVDDLKYLLTALQSLQAYRDVAIKRRREYAYLPIPENVMPYLYRIEAIFSENITPAVNMRHKMNYTPAEQYPPAFFDYFDCRYVVNLPVYWVSEKHTLKTNMVLDFSAENIGYPTLHLNDAEGNVTPAIQLRLHPVSGEIVAFNHAGHKCNPSHYFTEGINGEVAEAAHSYIDDGYKLVDVRVFKRLKGEDGFLGRVVLTRGESDVIAAEVRKRGRFGLIDLDFYRVVGNEAVPMNENQTTSIKR